MMMNLINVKQENKVYLGHGLAIFSAVAWGLTFVSTKILLETFTPLEILVIRFILGFVALFALYPKFNKINSISEELIFLFAGLSGNTFYFLLENSALNYSTVSNVGLLVTISPFLSGLLSFLFIKNEKITLNFFIGIIFGIIGVALIIFNGYFILELHILGDMLALLAAFSWAVYSFLLKKIGGFNYNPIAATRKIFFYGILGSLSLIPIFGFNVTVSDFLSLKNALNLIYLGFIASAICFVTWTMAVHLIGTVRSSVYIYLIPVITVIASILILDEKLTVFSTIGIVLILLGLSISNKKHKK